jgi:hypothetical protein
MRKLVVIEEYHLTVLVPRRLPQVEDDAIRQDLDDPRFVRQVRRAVRDVLRLYPALAKAKVKLSR